MIDGAAPFYDTYECADGRYIAVGAVEPAFYAQLLEGLGLSELPDQYDRTAWPRTRKVFEDAFGGRTRDEWVEQFTHLDACVTPVLALGEVPEHLHIAARDTIVKAFGQRQPAVAPRFAESPPAAYRAPRTPGSDNAAVLRDWGVAGDEHEQ